MSAVNELISIFNNKVVVFAAGEVVGLQLHEVCLHGNSVGSHAHLLLLQLPAVQRNRVCQGQSLTHTHTDNLLYGAT